MALPRARSYRSHRPISGALQQRFTPLTQYRTPTADVPSSAQAHSRPTTDDDAHTIMINRVAWGAIFAGAVVALVLQVMLTMLGVGIGMATLDPASGDNPAASTFSITAAVWWFISGIIAAFAGGYVAARMSGRTVPTTGAFHGLTTWAFTTLLVLYLLDNHGRQPGRRRLQRRRQRDRRHRPNGR